MTRRTSFCPFCSPDAAQQSAWKPFPGANCLARGPDGDWHAAFIVRLSPREGGFVVQITDPDYLAQGLPQVR